MIHGCAVPGYECPGTVRGRELSDLAPLEHASAACLALQAGGAKTSLLASDPVTTFATYRGTIRSFRATMLRCKPMGVFLVVFDVSQYQDFNLCIIRSVGTHSGGVA